MNILITGMNKNQCVENFYLRQELKVIPSHYSLIACLRDMGHRIEQAKFGEHSPYDQSIVFLAAPGQMVSINLFEGLEAIADNPDCILAFDDWQTDSILKSLMKCAEDFEKHLCREFVCSVTKKTVSDILAKKDVYLRGIDIILQKKNKVLMSAFAGGDLSLLIDWPEELLIRYNPNPYHHNRRPGNLGDTPIEAADYLTQTVAPSPISETVAYEDKRKIFNFASLVQSSTKKWLKNQDIQHWAIEYFGSKSEGQRRLTEGEMCRVFGEQWGCLMPGYKHSGSGWWRARPLQVADQRSILLGDSKELEIYYGKNNGLAFLTAHQVESMTLDELISHAEGQRSRIYELHPLDKSIQQNELKQIL